MKLDRSDQQKHVRQETDMTELVEHLEESTNGANNKCVPPGKGVADFKWVQKAKRPKREEGQAYWFFFKLGFGIKRRLLFIISVILTVLAGFCSEYYFLIWSDNIAEVANVVDAGVSSKNWIVDDDWFIFLVIAIIYTLCMWFFLVVFGSGLREAVVKLHRQMIDSLFGAKMSFFDHCDQGYLSTRYAGDFGVMDYQLVPVALFCISTILVTISSIISMTMVNPVQFVTFALLLACLIPILRARYKKSRLLVEMRTRLRAPLYTSLTAAIDEICTIRSEPDHLIHADRQFKSHLNRFTSLSLLLHHYDARSSIYLRIGVALMNFATYYVIFVIFWRDLELSKIGTFLISSLSSINHVPVIFIFGFALDGVMVSINNVKTLTMLEPEEEANKMTIKKVEPIKWTEGQLSFQRVSMRYTGHESPAIEVLSFCIRGGERVGVVGRTGAGKSSIFSALFRLYPFEGQILIDGVDIMGLNLNELRSSLGVIPQDPVLFLDSLRKNLDPSGQFTDEQIWFSLEVVNLKQLVLHDLPSGLEELISEGGRNLSVGQRQLICLARAVLRSPKILLIDEATANVDNETDNFIQQTIRAHFSASTIITVAHRLNTVLDYDRIMVLDAGRIVEFDPVPNLLELKDGIFKNMLISSSNRAGES